MPFTAEELGALPPRYTQAATVRFQDVDAAQLVFFPRVLEYLHDAYVGFLASVGQPLPAVLAERRWVAPIRHAEADYLRPLRFGDAIAVHLVGGRFERGVLTIGYRIDRLDGEAAATGSTVHVFLDPASFRRIEPGPELLAAFRILTEPASPPPAG